MALPPPTSPTGPVQNHAAITDAEFGGLGEFIRQVHDSDRQRISKTLYINNESVYVTCVAQGNGKIDIYIQRWGDSAAIKTARVSVSGGEVVLEGTYTRELRTLFELRGWKNPTTFIITEEIASAPVDQYMIEELRKYFGQKSGPLQAYTSKSRFVFTSNTAIAKFYTNICTFFGNGTCSDMHRILARDRWGSSDGPFEDILGEHSIDPAARAIPALSPIPHKDLPRLPTSRGDWSVTTVGSAAPSSHVSPTSHRLIRSGGGVVAVDMPAYAYSEGVDAIAITHTHADHFDPRAVLEQARINTRLHRPLTLLLGEDGADVIQALALADGWNPSSGQSAKSHLSQFRFLVARHFELGDIVVEMVEMPHAAHGTPNAGVTVLSNLTERPRYFYTGDGDYNLSNLRQQHLEIRLVIAERTYGGGGVSPAVLARYDSIATDTLIQQVERLERAIKLLTETPLVDVDTGTTGKDCHGSAETPSTIRKARLSSRFGRDVVVTDVLREEARCNELMHLAGQGDRQGVLEFLARNGVADEGLRMAVVDELFSVRPTHSTGYGALAGVPDIDEGRTDVWTSGTRTTHVPKLNSELRRLGATFGEGIEVKFGGTEVHLRDCAASRGAIRRLTEAYSATTPKGETVFALSGVRINADPINDWLTERGIAPIARPALPPPGPIPQKPPTYMGLSLETPPWLAHLNGRARAIYHMCGELLRNAERIGLPSELAEYLRRIMDSPTIFSRFAAIIEGSPGLAKMTAAIILALKIAGPKIGKAFGPVVVALLTGAVIYLRRDKLLEGDADAWSETGGDLAGAAAGIPAFVIDGPFTLTYYLTRLIANGFGFGPAWEDTSTMAFPVANSVRWMVTTGLKILHGIF